MSSSFTRNKLYEEHTNFDFTCEGSRKIQTFNLRLDTGDDLKQPREKKHWKINHRQAAQNILPATITQSSCEDNDITIYEPATKIQKTCEDSKNLSQTFE